MTLPYKPTRTFDANVGDPSTGNAGPDGLKADIDKLRKMFDPDAIHDNGDSGGIHKGNLANESGIVTVDNVNSYINDRKFSLSGSVGTDKSIPAGATLPLQQISVVVPSGKKLYLKKARFYFPNNDLRLDVSVYDINVYNDNMLVTRWNSSVAGGEEDVNIELCSSDVSNCVLVIGVKNGGSSSSIAFSFDGWLVDFEIGTSLFG